MTGEGAELWPLPQRGRSSATPDLSGRAGRRRRRRRRDAQGQAGTLLQAWISYLGPPSGVAPQSARGVPEKEMPDLLKEEETPTTSAGAGRGRGQVTGRRSLVAVVGFAEAFSDTLRLCSAGGSAQAPGLPALPAALHWKPHPRQRPQGLQVRARRLRHPP